MTRYVGSRSGQVEGTAKKLYVKSGRSGAVEGRRADRGGLSYKEAGSTVIASLVLFIRHVLPWWVSAGEFCAVTVGLTAGGGCGGVVGRAALLRNTGCF